MIEATITLTRRPPMYQLIERAAPPSKVVAIAHWSSRDPFRFKLEKTEDLMLTEITELRNILSALSKVEERE